MGYMLPKWTCKPRPKSDWTEPGSSGARLRDEWKLWGTIPLAVSTVSNAEITEV